MIVIVVSRLAGGCALKPGSRERVDGIIGHELRGFRWRSAGQVTRGAPSASLRLFNAWVTAHRFSRPTCDGHAAYFAIACELPVSGSKLHHGH